MLDNLSTHDTPEVRGMAGRQPEHHLPRHPNRLELDNQIAIWFGVITRQAIRRGTFVSVNHLNDRIRTYV